MLQALISDGPFKGWTLESAIAIQQGMPPVDAKAKLIKHYQAEKVRQIAVLDAAIASTSALPDKIVWP